MSNRLLLALSAILCALSIDTISLGMISVYKLPENKKLALRDIFKPNKGREIAFKAVKERKISKHETRLDVRMPILYSKEAIAMIALDQLYNSLMSYLEKVDVSNANISHFSAEHKLAILGSWDQQNRKTVDFLQAQRFEILLALPKEEATRRINDEFKKIEEQLSKNEIDTQNELRQAYNINANSEDWRVYMLQAHARNKFDLASMKRTWKNTSWNPNLPIAWIEDVTDALRDNELEPTAFSLLLDNSNETPYIAAYRDPRSHCIGAANISLDEYDKNPEKEIWQYKENEPSFIIFHPENAKKQNCYPFMKSIAHHEVTHAVKGHISIRVGVRNAIRACTNSKTEDIILHPVYAKFILAQEITADTSAALKNPEIAHCARLCPLLYPGSYNILATADTNWKILELINSK